MNIAEDLIKDKNRELVGVPTTTTVKDGVALMMRENVGCLLVSVDGEIRGIWSERDLARNIAVKGFFFFKNGCGNCRNNGDGHNKGC